MGKGEKTIVLLPGLGVPLPSVDFHPLMQDLAKSHTVVCIEYFGYGFSDKTDTPRTNENYTEEIRESLSLLGLQPPYILLPYSASGIYAEYYAATYPEEVEALILLDTTSSAQKDLPVPKFVITLAKIQNAIGLNRVLNRFLTPKMLGLCEENGYTKQEIREIAKFTNHTANDTINNQLIQFPKNVEEMMALDIPREIPILSLSAAKSAELEKGTSYAKHLKKLGEHTKSQIIPNSNHGNIYHNRVHRSAILEAIEDFLLKSEGE